MNPIKRRWCCVGGLPRDRQDLGRPLGHMCDPRLGGCQPLGMLSDPCLSPCPTERPLHYSEKVLPILHCLGTESYLVVKKQMSMENMLIYLGEELGGARARAGRTGRGRGQGWGWG